MSRRHERGLSYRIRYDKPMKIGRFFDAQEDGWVW
jgi:hypothetical protein